MNNALQGHRLSSLTSTVFDFFREPVCQSREATHVHPHREVGTLRIGRADMLRVRLAFDRRLDRATAFGWAISAFGAV